MKIAIHHYEGSFSQRWINYCVSNNINYKIVNCYDNDIIEQLADCDALMWHFHQEYYIDLLMARRLLFALEHAGKQVFPNFHSSWHFDDKVAQKYLLEALNVPAVQSYAFYEKKSAIEFVNKTSYPIVFKLSNGAGAINVRLIKNKEEALKLVKKAFNKGFSKFNRLAHFKERLRKFRNGKDTFSGVVKGVGRLIIPTALEKYSSREKAYIYFQKFIPNNITDTRIIVIGNKAFGIVRGVREGDFRASGSGDISYDKSSINIKCVETAFKVNDALKAQVVAYDFIFDEYNNPLIVEISYGFAVKPYDICPGYWDSNLKWHDGKFNPQEWMIENFINLIEKGNEKKI